VVTAVKATAAIALMVSISKHSLKVKNDI